MDQNNKNYQVINLYKDDFNPVYDLEEMRLFHVGKTHDPLVKKYLNWLRKTPEVILITPFWWSNLIY